MKAIEFSYDENGLHADNPHHPGITEEDIRAVLQHPAYVGPDTNGRKNILLATGATAGVYEILTVVYYNGKALTAITAYPSNRTNRTAYLAALSKGEGLWIPANDME